MKAEDRLTFYAEHPFSTRFAVDRPAFPRIDPDELSNKQAEICRKRKTGRSAVRPARYI
jgi:hypothetical protein